MHAFLRGYHICVLCTVVVAVHPNISEYDIQCYFTYTETKNCMLCCRLTHAMLIR